MLVAMVILKFKINEPKLLEETKDDVELGEKLSQSIEEIKEDKPLSKKDVTNLIIILVAVFFWFMAFNAIETFNSLFCRDVLGSEGIHGTFTIILTVSSIISFVLLSGLANKIGRKWTIVLGLILLVVGIGLMALFTFILREQIESYVWVIYLLTVIIGIGWALVNINSYPMIVEMANKSNVGKFTGYYYTASMIAQTATPILVGLIMSFNDAGLKLLYLYSLITMLLATLVFMFVVERRDLNKKKEKKGILENLGDLD
jgi:MFS family permease